MVKTKQPLTSYMVRKKKKRQREYMREYYAKNREKIRAQQSRKRLETTELIIPDTTRLICTDTKNLTSVQSVSVTKERVKIVIDELTLVVDKSMRLTICSS